MPYLILLSFLLLALAPQAQNTFPAGCYMSQEELLAQQPSRAYDVEIAQRPRDVVMRRGGNDYRLYRADRSVKKKVLKKKVYAYSDGQSLYLNARFHRCRNWYTKTLTGGPYIVFEAPDRKGAKFGKMTLVSVVEGDGLVNASRRLRHERYYYLFNTFTGKTFKLNKGNLKALFTDYPEIKAAYDAAGQPNTGKALIKYVEMMNAVERERF